MMTTLPQPHAIGSFEPPCTRRGLEAVDLYHVSKHAAVALSETLYHELADSAPQIKVSIFMPGLINTELYLAEESRP